MADLLDLVIVAFDGALNVRERAHPKRTFALEATSHLDKLGDSRGVVGAEQKSPLHFHPH
ncbi:hypothetical protein HD806DRAFT_259058 [Xylariaceae sp. AK1471]|nr:hypothetical protein HD806DRAFT_259058 [Xylariaceae sp. AK1471]